MKRKCYEFTVKDRVQDIGLRLAIAKEIPDELDVRVDNLPEGSVRVLVRGHEQEVREFWERLQKHILGKVDNPTFSEPNELAEASIETDRFFHKLQCEQMGKFVDVGLKMKTSMDGMKQSIDGMKNSTDGMKGSIDGMKDSMDGMKQSIDGVKGSIDGLKDSTNGMKGSIDGMSSKLDKIDSRLDILPGNMAKELVKLKKDGVF